MYIGAMNGWNVVYNLNIVNKVDFGVASNCMASGCGSYGFFTAGGFDSCGARAQGDMGSAKQTAAAPSTCVCTYTYQPPVICSGNAHPTLANLVKGLTWCTGRMGIASCTAASWLKAQCT
jgi:hypothetical protein